MEINKKTIKTSTGLALSKSWYPEKSSFSIVFHVWLIDTKVANFLGFVVSNIDFLDMHHLFASYQALRLKLSPHPIAHVCASEQIYSSVEYGAPIFIFELWISRLILKRAQVNAPPSRTNRPTISESVISTWTHT